MRFKNEPQHTISDQNEGEFMSEDYDAGSMRFTNDEEANGYLDKSYRPGFGLV